MTRFVMAILLALVGMFGIFAFNGAQPAQADGIGSATVSVGDSMTGAMTDYTFSVTTNAALVENTFINLDPPMGYTVAEGTMQGSVDGTSATVSARAGGAYDVALSVGVNSGAMVTIVIPGLMDPATAGTYTRMVDSRLGNAAAVSAMVTIGDGMTPTDPMTGMVDVSNASVTARPDDPGDATQITVMFETNMYLAIDESITVEVSDDLGVPSSIDAADVSISGMASAGAGGATSHEVASPRSIIVEEDSVAERFVITMFIGDMNDDGPEQGLAPGEVSVTFRQGAGLTNRTEGGSDDWFVKTSAESDLAEIGDVYSVPWTISLSSYADSRGEEITAIGKGFKNGTTTYFWRDADRDGYIGAGESVLCDAIASRADIAECTFTLSNPPFAPGTAGNYVNAVDGRGNTAGDSGRMAEFKQVELESSMFVSPKQGLPGDPINVQLYDFQTGDVVTRIEFARTVDICDDDAETDIPTCSELGASRAVGHNGSLSFSFEIPSSVSPGAQDLRVHTTNGNANTIFSVRQGELQLSTTDVLPNQRIYISGAGFTKSPSWAPAYIGDPDGDNSCPNNGYYVGSVTLGGQAIGWDRINDGDGTEVTSGGTWSAPLDLPVNTSTTAAGTRELKIIDCFGGVATADLTFAERIVTMTPAEGGVGTEVVISGKNFPVRNNNGSDIEVFVEYEAGVDSGDVDPDAFGNFTVILQVPEGAYILSENIVSVRFYDDEYASVLHTFTHRVPQGTVSISASMGPENSVLTIEAKGFAGSTLVDIVEFGDRDITPIPKPSTDTNGNAEFTVQIPVSDPGIYIIRVEIDQAVATSTFTVVAGLGRFDTNNSGEIEKDEVLQAISDYLFGVDGDVTKDDVLAVIRLYLFGG